MMLSIPVLGNRPHEENTDIIIKLLILLLRLLN